MDRKRGHINLDINNFVSSLVWLKVVAVGNVASGKTSIIKFFCENKFGTGYQPTVGVDYGFKIHNVQNTDVRVHLWDLSGDRQYADVRNELYVDTDAVILVYDVTNVASFECLDLWADEIHNYGLDETVNCLIANKTDLTDRRVVSTSDGKNWASIHGMRYQETSCVTGDGVVEMMTSLIDAAYSKRQLDRTLNISTSISN